MTSRWNEKASRNGVRTARRAQTKPAGLLACAYIPILGHCQDWPKGGI